ncbi:UNVERIFIED_CONTAM: RGG repeats nuclear RNA binding protein A [Sesamum calycinum]|uniref:RGG repeats nuclear RNA binding protein A n=1 Tax=Sesamum calycinum TaxID=2727403 RepID=A0AAW2LZ52_9LAMI
MATLNPFGLLGDDDAEDPTLLLAAQQKAAGPAKATVQEKKSPSQAQPAAKLLSEPLPPAQAGEKLKTHLFISTVFFVEMTLEEYEKALEEKRKALLALKSQERKVDLDKELESMQLLSNKRNDDDVFIKLMDIDYFSHNGGTMSKVSAALLVHAKSFVSVSINEFLKPAEVETYYQAGGRGRGRGRGRGGYGGNNYDVQALAIEDVGQFPSLVAK